MWKKYFPQPIYDTKALSASCGSQIFQKTELHFLFEKCTKEKKLKNNLVIEADVKKASIFGQYICNEGEEKLVG
jgi:hypothetical protein